MVASLREGQLQQQSRQTVNVAFHGTAQGTLRRGPEAAGNSPLSSCNTRVTNSTARCSSKTSISPHRQRSPMQVNTAQINSSAMRAVDVPAKNEPISSPRTVSKSAATRASTNSSTSVKSDVFAAAGTPAIPTIRAA